METASTRKSGSLNKIVKWVGGIIALVAMIAWTGGFLHSKVEAGKLDVKPGIDLPKDAEIFKVKVKDIAPRIDVVGTAASEEKVHLSARLGAYIKDVFASAGDVVTKGQSLITLDDREIREQMAAAQVQLKQAKTEYKRTRKLFEKKATTEQALTAAESMYNAAQTQVERIKVMLTYAVIKSPIDGIVTDRRAEKGDLANPGQILLRVYDPQNMRLEVPVPVRLIEKLTLGQVVNIKLDRPDRPFTGKVTEIVSEIDPRSRTQFVKVHIDQAKGEVLPGTFGRIWVLEDTHPAMLVPQSSVYMIGQLEMVQVVENQRVLRKLVKTGAVYGDKIEVLSGVKDNDTILVKPVKEG